jgi:hypothetical protein
MRKVELPRSRGDWWRRELKEKHDDDAQQPSTIPAERADHALDYATRDASIGAYFRNQVEAMGITAVDTTPRSPQQSARLHTALNAAVLSSWADRVSSRWMG